MTRRRSARRRVRAVLLLASLLAGAAGARAAEADAPPPSEPPEAPGPADTAPAAEAVALSPHDVPPQHALSPSRLTPAEIGSLIKLGGTLAERGDYAAAEIAYHQVLSSTVPTEEDTKSALLGLARMHRRQGMLTKASALYEKYLEEYAGDARTPDALLELGRTLRAMGAHRLAIARFYSVINSTLKMPGEGFEHYQLLARTAQYEIAETHFQAGNFTEANKFFSRLRLLDLAAADRARAHFKAAYSLYLGGDLEGAVTTLNAYLEQWPDDANVPEARYVLAMSLRGLNRSQQAFAVTLDLLREEQTRHGADSQRWTYWQRRTGNLLANDFFENGDALSAQAIYAVLAGLSAEPAWRLPATYQLALCYERLGQTAEARAAYETIVAEAGAAEAADLAELARMAAWRRDQLDWRTDLDQQMASFFAGAPPPAAASTPAPSAPATPSIP